MRQAFVLDFMTFDLLRRFVIFCSASTPKPMNGRRREWAAACLGRVMVIQRALSARGCLSSVGSKRWSTSSHVMYTAWSFKQCNGASFTRESNEKCVRSICNQFFPHSFGSPPSYRDFHTATVINDRMYIFGGRGDVHSPYHSQDEIYCPKIVYLDLNSHQWIMPLTSNKQPLGRRSHSACEFQLLPCWHIQRRRNTLVGALLIT